MRGIIASLMLAGAVVAASCSGNKVYDHYEHTPIAGWDRADALTYCVPAMTSAGRYATTVGLRINGSYPFQTISLIVEQAVFPSGKVYSDTVSCQLFSSKGTVKGRGVSCFQYNYRISERELREGDSLRVTVRHNMRREIMPGVSDVGVEIDRQ